MFDNLGATEFILLFIISIPIILWIIALTDILKNDFEGNEKLVWVILILFLPILGALLYFSIGRLRKKE